MLDINPVALTTQIVCFVLLVMLLNKFAMKPVGNMISARQAEISESLDRVAADRKAMQDLRADYEQRLASIEAEAREHVAGAIKQAQQEAAGILARAREEASAQRDRALAEIDLERRKAVVEIRSQMADLAVIAAGKILEREINPGTHRDLVDSFIQQVGSPN